MPYGWAMSHGIWFETDGDAAARSTTQALTQRGYRVFRSFDLRSAAAHWSEGGPTECQCPHHGTEQCTCQYVVLLAYGPDGAPAVITVHSRDTRSEVQIVQDANPPAEASSLDPVALAVLAAAAATQARALANAEP